MPFVLSALSSSALSNIESNWPGDWKLITENAQKLILAFAQAFADGFSQSLRNAMINGGIILGGAAPTGGPVVGATLNIPVGGLTMAAPDLQSHFIAPSYQVIASFNRQIQPGSNSTWHKALVKECSNALDDAFTAWTPSWMLTGGSAYGGVSTWIPTPPAPGVWTAGTIVPFTFIGQGTNASPALETFPTTFTTEAQAVSVTVSTDRTRTEQTKLSNSSSRPMLQAIAKGLLQTIDDAFQQIMVKDPSGTGASGVSLVGGVVASGVISGLVLDVA
jgi:hypothetical protein